MLPNIKRNAVAGLVALSLAAPASPALAWGEKEQNGLAALVALGVIGSLLYKQDQARPQPAQRSYQTDPYAGQYPRYTAPNSSGSSYSAPSTYRAPATSGIYDSAAARAFNAYSPAERRAIQSRMQSWGYYHGGIDGSFGPMTYRAVMAYAGDTKGTDSIATVPGAFQLFDTMIR